MKRWISLSLAVLALALLLCSFSYADSVYIIDNDGLLAEEEVASLNQQAAEVSEKYQCSVCVLTTPDLYGKSAEAFAEDYFDQNHMGYNGGYDGILLVVSMAERDYYVTSAGLAERALTGDRLYTLENAFVRYLSSGDYYEAFSSYIRQCDYQLLHKDDPLPGEEPNPTRTVGGVLASLGLGFLGSLLPVGAMKSKNTNVAKKQTATNYARPGSLQMYVQNDNYLRTETSRVLIRTDSGRPGAGGGGGSSHISSGGVSHTGGGGKF